MNKTDDFVITNGILEKYIGTDAEVVIPNGVIGIGDRAFQFNNTTVTAITFPEAVTEINIRVIDHCDNLEYIRVDKNNVFFAADENGILFNKDKTAIIKYPRKNACKNYIVPNSVTVISERAFSKSDNLESVVIPDSVTTLGEEAFWGCYELTTVNIPDSVKSIGESAFEHCELIESITLPEGITKIPYKFAGSCRSLKSFFIPSTVKEISPYAFDDCESLLRIVVDNNNQAYSTDENGILFNKKKTELVKYPTNLPFESYAVPDSVRTFSKNAFAGCRNLKHISIPEGVCEIGYGAFSYFSGLISVTIPEGVTHIERSAFSDCENLVSVFLPDSLTFINYHVFFNCKKLKTIRLSDNVNYVYENAFLGCDSLVDIRACEAVSDIVWKILTKTQKHNVCCYKLKNGIALNKKQSRHLKMEAESFWNSVFSSGDADMLRNMLSYYKKPDVEMLDMLLEKSTHHAELNLFLIEYKNKLYPPEKLQREQEEKLEKDLGLVERTEKDWKKLFGTREYDGELEILKYKGKDELVEIPEKIGNCPVRWIKEGAFKNNRYIHTVVIPGSIIKIGWEAFKNCKNLERVIVNEGVRQLGNNAFENCTQLQRIILPSSLTKIGYNCFLDSSNNFDKNLDGVEINAPSSGEAIKYAKRNKLKYSIIK